MYSVGSELHLLTIATNSDRVVTTAKGARAGRPRAGRALLGLQRARRGNEAGPRFVPSCIATSQVENPCVRAYSRTMERARRHQRLLSALAFGLLALVAELLGRSLTHRLDFGRHVAPPSYAHADYYPILLGVVKGGIALLLVRLLWRVARAHFAERSARRLVGGASRLPKLRFALSARLCLSFFLLTSVIYLVQADAEGAEVGRWPLLSPWLHSSALPVFAVLSVDLRRRLERRARAASPTTRSTRRRPSTGRAASSAAARCTSPGRAFCSRSLRAASSASRSRAVRRRFLPDPPRALTPRDRLSLSSAGGCFEHPSRNKRDPQDTHPSLGPRAGRARARAGHGAGRRRLGLPSALAPDHAPSPRRGLLVARRRAAAARRPRRDRLRALRRPRHRPRPGGGRGR